MVLTIGALCPQASLLEQLGRITPDMNAAEGFLRALLPWANVDAGAAPANAADGAGNDAADAALMADLRENLRELMRELGENWQAAGDAAGEGADGEGELDDHDDLDIN